MEKQKKELGEIPFLFIHPSLSEKLSVKEGEQVLVYSRVGEMAARIKISDKYPPNAVVMYQGGSVENRACANIITDDSLISDYGEMAAYYSNKVNIRKY